MCKYVYYSDCACKIEIIVALIQLSYSFFNFHFMEGLFTMLEELSFVEHCKHIICILVLTCT
jgi:hypothetical protein